MNYQEVKNAITARLNKISRKDCKDQVSCQLWLESLQNEKNYLTLFKVHENGPFLVSWVSPWQKTQLEEALEWCIDSTHKTCKTFSNPSDYSYLFTIVVRSQTTNKGVPVCFFITSHEIVPTLKTWLEWLNSNLTLRVKRIMIDCSPTEIRAIKEVFDNNNVDILLCHWHIKRAWETHIKRDVKVANSTHETKRLQDSVRASLNNMMHADTEETFNLSLQLFQHQYKDQQVFLAYFDKLWVAKKRIMEQSLAPGMLKMLHVPSYINTISDSLISMPHFIPTT